MNAEIRIDKSLGLAFPATCPICLSPYITFVKNLPRRLGGEVALFYCMACESACSPLSPSTAHSDVTAWHLSVHDRNKAWASALFDKIGAKGPIVDIGCGIGSLLFAAREKGLAGTGYDLNPWASELGRTRFGLDLRTENWSRSSAPPAKTITCISVLEHIHQPRKLIFDLVGAVQDLKATLFISVPFFSRAQWPKLLTDNLQPGHFFEVPHAHVTHFSPTALEKLCLEAGAGSVEALGVEKAWYGFVVRPKA